MEKEEGCKRLTRTAHEEAVVVGVEQLLLEHDRGLLVHLVGVGDLVVHVVADSGAVVLGLGVPHGLDGLLGEGLAGLIPLAQVGDGGGDLVDGGGDDGRGGSGKDGDGDSRSHCCCWCLEGWVGGEKNVCCCVLKRRVLLLGEEKASLGVGGPALYEGGFGCLTNDS